MSAGAAVVRIRIHRSAYPAANDGTLHARINARAIKAFAILVGSGVSTPGAAASAVVEVVGQISAVVAATGLANVPAVVAAGAAVRVRAQIAAHSVASHGLAADVASAGSAQAARVAVTGLAGREALVLLCFIGTPAERLARVRFGQLVSVGRIVRPIEAPFAEGLGHRRGNLSLSCNQKSAVLGNFGLHLLLQGDRLAAALTAIWVTERDGRVCPICRPLDGQVDVDWEDQFPNGPPAHPNCRCWLKFEPAENLAWA